MTVEQARQLIGQCQYDQAVDLLATLPESPEVLVCRWQAAHPIDRPEALQAAAALSTMPVAPELLVLILNWAIRKKHLPVVVSLGRQQMGLRASDFDFLLRLGMAASGLALHHLSLMCLNQALLVADTDIQRAGCHSVLGMVYKDYGQVRQAYAHFAKAYLLSGGRDELNNVAMCGQYAQSTLGPFYAQMEDFRRFSDVRRVVHPIDRLDPAKAKTGLRIGLLSGDFLSHTLTPLIYEILQAITQITDHQLYFYQNRPDSADASTAAYKQLATGWQNITDRSTTEVVQQMQVDQLDVLIDLAGNTAANRLDVLAYRPAPVQIGWVCGMMTPCAVETVPYFLADRGMLTPEIRAACPEQLLELPTAYVYFPAAAIPVHTGLPVDRTDVLAFGCLNNQCKVLPETLDAWAQILKALPTSQLHLKVGSQENAVHFGRELFTRGVNRQQFVPVLPINDYLSVQRYYAERIDIALDTWPCTGLLTTLDAWWAGVPTVTLTGQTFVHNQTASVLKHVRAEDLITATPADYVAKALSLAADRPRLRTIRAECRRRLDESLVRQPLAAAKSVSDAIGWCWTDWCTSRRTLAEQSSGSLPSA